MVFIIPDNLLENMRCSNCKKYLSVGPVKVYSDGKTKCGRCSTEMDRGTPSMYNKILNEGLFRCIYRYEGCNVILNSSDMKTHEMQHKNSVTFECPLCPDLKERMEAYMIHTHFRECHQKEILSQNKFEIDLTADFEKVFLYSEKDYLFFVAAIFNIDFKEFRFDIIHLGVKLLKISYMFEIVSSNTYFPLYKRNRACFIKNGPFFGNTDIIYLDVQNQKCLLKFELNVPENVLSLDENNMLLSKQDSCCIITLPIDKFSATLSKHSWNVSSSVYLFYGLKFKLFAQVETDISDNKMFSLCVAVNCNNEKQPISGRLYCKFSLLSVKPGIKNFYQEVFENEILPYIIVSDFKPFYEILDPKNGFIKDDKITVKAEIKVLHLSCVAVEETVK